ncbi:hypothetical protein ACWD6I_27295, partial [Streptomyces sp. NPDC002454]
MPVLQRAGAGEKVSREATVRRAGRSGVVRREVPHPSTSRGREGPKALSTHPTADAPATCARG